MTICQVGAISINRSRIMALICRLIRFLTTARLCTFLLIEIPKRGPSILVALVLERSKSVDE